MTGARLLVLGSLLVAACETTSGGSASLTSGPLALTIVDGGKTMVLSRGGKALLSFDAASFSLATVPSIDPARSYDPWQAEPEGFPADYRDAVWRAARAWTVAYADDELATLHVSFDGDVGATISIAADATDRYSLAFKPDLTQPIAYLRASAVTATDEAFYGLGEWPEVNHRGHRRPMQIEAQALESSDDENHVPVPLVIGTSGWGLFAESRRPGVFDVAEKDPARLELTYGTAEDSDGGLLVHLFAADHPLDVTRHYYDLTGDPVLPAPWGLGPWFWRNDISGQAELEADLDTIRDLDLPTSGIWLDRPYATAVNSFDFDPKLFTDPQALIDKAHALGMRVALWSSPYLETATDTLYDTAIANHYFPPVQSITLNSWSPPIDFTNPDAYAYWQSLIGRYTAYGIEGWKLDYGEDITTGLGGVRFAWGFADGSTELTMHHGYTTLYHRVYAETQPTSGGYLLCRAGRWGDQTHVSVIWPGDLDATFSRRGDPVGKIGDAGVGGLPVAVGDALSLGPSGFPLFASDTGGFRASPPTRELFLRWTEHTALSMVMNVGDASSQAPWEYNAANGRDDASLAIYRDYARLHMRLFPYLWTYAQQLHVDGRPILRALGLAHPELGVHPDDVYLLGDSLLVAPVVTEGQTSRELTIPPGVWINWWTGEAVDGGAVTIQAPIDQIPLLLAPGGIVPLLRPTIDSLAPTTVPTRVDSLATAAGVLWARASVLGDGSFTIYDGTKLAMAGGVFSIEPGSLFAAGAVVELLGGSAHLPVSTHVDIDGQTLAPAASLDALVGAHQGWIQIGSSFFVRLPPGSHTAALK